MKKVKSNLFIQSLSGLGLALCIILLSLFSIAQSQASYLKGHHGHYITHYPNGQLRYSINYVEGKREGAELSYFESGKIKEKQFYKNNEKEGEAFSFYENGRPHIKSFYSNGKLEGEQITYHENGTIAFSEYYRRGVKDGLRKAYNDQGMLEADQRFINGDFDPLFVGVAKLPNCSLTSEQVKKKLKGLCMAISERGEDPFTQGRYRWLHQRKS